MNSLDYAKKCCDTIMRQFPNGELPPVGPFHYHAGVFLHGMEEVYLLCGEKKYDNYIFNWLNPFIEEDGNIKNRQEGSVDAVQATNLLIRYAETKNFPSYEKALKKTAEKFFDWKVNSSGGFWHLPDTPNQMWLDSVYMASLFLTRYGIYSGDVRFLNMAQRQFKLLWEHNRDTKTGLLYHAWDASIKADWADKETGRSPEVWGRALGWYMATSALVAQILPEGRFKEEITDYAVSLAKCLVEFQDKEDGMWYQVVDKGNKKDNWKESSCTCLFTFGICKLIQMGVLDDKKYTDAAKKAYNTIIREYIGEENDDVFVKNVCMGTGVGDYDYYISRPIKDNDLHGTGAFTLMATQYYKTFEESGGHNER